MAPTTRRIVYAVAYETLGALISTLGLAFFGKAELGSAAGLAVVTSVIALLWNVGFNAAFEHWESRRTVKGRSLANRAAHAILFELGLTFLLVPIIAVWLGVSLLTAFLLDFGLIVFFAVYTFVFNWAFDGLFGLPESAR